MSRLILFRAVLAVSLLGGAVAAPLGAGSTGVGEAQAPPLMKVGSIDIGMAPSRLAADARHILVASGTQLRVFDMSRSESPKPAGAFDFDHPVLGLAVGGDTAYVANSHDGLRRLELSGPSSPVVTGTHETRGQAVGVAMSGAYLFVGDNSLGFDVVDGTGDLSRVGEYLADGFPRGIAAAGSLVFVADQPTGLVVVDVSAPDAPQVAGRLSLGPRPGRPGHRAGGRLAGRRIAGGRLHGERARRAAGGGRLPPGRARGDGRDRDRRPALPARAMWGNRVYVASGEQLQAFDLTDPEPAPRSIGSAEVDGRAGPGGGHRSARRLWRPPTGSSSCGAGRTQACGWARG